MHDMGCTFLRWGKVFTAGVNRRMYDALWHGKYIFAIFRENMSGKSEKGILNPVLRFNLLSIFSWIELYILKCTEQDIDTLVLQRARPSIPELSQGRWKLVPS